MLKHRQTLTCRANLQAASRDSSTLVVTVYNYQGDGDQIGHSNPIIKSQIVTPSTPVTESQFVSMSVYHHDVKFSDKLVLADHIPRIIM